MEGKGDFFLAGFVLLGSMFLFKLSLSASFTKADLRPQAPPALSERESRNPKPCLEGRGT